MNIVIIRQDHLGDLVLTTPLIRALSLAGHQVTVVARRSSLPVLEGNPHVSRLVALEDLAPEFPRGILALGSGIRKLRPDLILVPDAKPTKMLLGVRAGFFGKIITMRGGAASRFLLCRSLSSGLPSRLRHYSEVMLDFAREIGVPADGLKLEIFLNEQEREAGKAQLQERIGARKVVIVHPGSAGNTCNLPIDIYAELVERLLGRSEVGIVLSGIASEREKFRADFSRFEGNPRVWNSMGEFTLRQLCAIIAQSSALVSVGTGPLHLASALRVATVSPFCRRRGLCSRVWGNLGAAKSVVIEPPESICAGREGLGHCNFESTLGADQLLEALRPFVS